MNWLRLRKADAEQAARKLAEADQKIIDQAKRLLRLEAYVETYKRMKGLE